MKISASVYSNKERSLADLVTELDRYHVDYIHIDCKDDPSVFEDIKEIKKISRTPIDLHIISPDPPRFYDGIRSTGVEMVSFQYEPMISELKVPAGLNTRLGLAIISETPVSIFSKFNGEFDFVLFMATEPGKSGGTFNKVNFQRIRKFKILFPEIKIHVDGGVNDEVSFVLRNMGVSLIVSGSYLVNAEYPGAAMHQLRSDNIQSHIVIRDFMTMREESPVLIKGTFGFQEVLQTIENYNFGFTIVITPDGKLEGIITNADVRRGLLKSFSATGRLPRLTRGTPLNAGENIAMIDPDKIINRSPIAVNSMNTVSELLTIVRQARFPVLYLPVVDDENRFCGTLSFTNLIKGE